MAWNHFASWVKTCPVLGIPEPVLLQHFQFGLCKCSAMTLHARSGGSFVLLSPEKGKEHLEDMQEFCSLSDLCVKTPPKEEVEPPRTIISKVRSFSSIIPQLWLKIPILSRRSLRGRASCTDSTSRFLHHFFS